MAKRKLIILLILTALGWGAAAQQVLTLEECHQMALEANYSMKRAEEKKIETEALEKVALWQMLPKVSANGAYMWMDKNIHLLSQEQQDRINNLGTTAQGSINNSLIEQLSGLGLPSALLESIINGTLNNTRLETTLNGVGHDITSAMQLDMSNVMVGTVTVTQPIYLGGKLRAAYRTTQMLNELSGIQYDKQRDDLLLQVDEAYWHEVLAAFAIVVAQLHAGGVERHAVEPRGRLALAAEIAPSEPEVLDNFLIQVVDTVATAVGKGHTNPKQDALRSREHLYEFVISFSLSTHRLSITLILLSGLPFHIRA